jgi:hypothetical protein
MRALPANSFMLVSRLAYSSTLKMGATCPSKMSVDFQRTSWRCGSTRYHSWLRHYSTSRKAAGSIPGGVLDFFNLSNSSSRTMALGSIQLLTEMSTRKLAGIKGRSARKADNLTAICEPIV